MAAFDVDLWTSVDSPYIVHTFRRYREITLADELSGALAGRQRP